MRGERGTNGPQKRRPRPDLADPGERLRAVRIVEAEHARLREDVGRAEAAGMLRIAFDLGRPSFVAFDEKTGGDAAKRHCGRKEKWLARDDLFRLADVRHDLFLGLARARSQAGERERGAHEFQEGPALDRIGNGFDLRRKLVVQTLSERRVAGQFVQRAPPAVAAERFLAAMAGPAEAGEGWVP